MSHKYGCRCFPGEDTYHAICAGCHTAWCRCRCIEGRTPASTRGKDVSDPPNVGVARYVGSVPKASVPNDLDELTSFVEATPLEKRVRRSLESYVASREVGDVELYHVDPPLEGFHVIAATQMLWAICIGEDGPVDDPVSTTFYGVSGGESVRIERDHPLTDTADGRNPVNALADLGYVIH